MNTQTEIPTLLAAEQSFLHQLETPEFFASRGGGQDRTGTYSGKPLIAG